MSTTTTIKLTIAEIERLPNYQKRTANEWSAACPFCQAGEDRFRFWPGDHNFWCRVCDTRGFVADSNTLTFDREAWLKWQAEETRRKQTEREKQLSTLERLNRENKTGLYHAQMKDRSFWYDKGLLDETIDWYELGYCPSCPTAPGQESYTIPVMHLGKLYNIRHRLTQADDKGKYRPEMAGLPAAMFNTDTLYHPGGYVALVEGEIKAMVLEQWGISAVGIPGANVFKSKWLNLFPKSKVVFIALDPDKQEQAVSIGYMFKNAGIPARVCRFKVKPDDFLVLGEKDKEDFMRVLKAGRNLL